MGSLLNSHLIYISRRILGLVNRSITWITWRESWPQTQFPEMSYFTDPESPLWKGSCVLLRRLSYLSFSYPSPKGPIAICLAEGETMIFWGLPDNGFWTNTNSRGPKHRCGPVVKSRGLWSQVINGVLAQSVSVGLAGPWAHPVVIFPVSECTIGTDILSNE